jgi:hypothetical protein
MNASAEPQDGGRGVNLLLRHMTAFERIEKPRPSAQERLVETLGEEFAAFLVGALVGERPLRAAEATAA